MTLDIHEPIESSKCLKRRRKIKIDFNPIPRTLNNHLGWWEFLWWWNMTVFIIRFYKSIQADTTGLVIRCDALSISPTNFCRTGRDASTIGNVTKLVIRTVIIDGAATVSSGCKHILGRITNATSILINYEPTLGGAGDAVPTLIQSMTGWANTFPVFCYHKPARHLTDDCYTKRNTFSTKSSNFEQRFILINSYHFSIYTN